MANYNVPQELRYSKTHEWVKDLGDNVYRMGISEYAAKNIGDVTYVELPEADSELEKDDTECVVETVKSSEDVYNQIGGNVSATNADKLDEAPETLNSDNYGEGWLYEITAENDSDFNDLMSAQEYEEYLATLD